jgi:hypothetical protein
VREDNNSLETAVDRICSPDNQQRHYLLLLQSSGYGKTRTCLNLIEKNRRGVYLLCQPVTDGFNSCNFIAQLMGLNPTNTNVVKFLMQLENFIEAHSTHADLFAAQFDKVTKKYRTNFFEERKRNLRPLDESRMDAIVRRLEQDGSTSGQSPVDLVTEPRSNSASPVEYVLIFDEAHNLGPALLAALKRALDHFKMVGVFLSKFGHLMELSPLTHSTRLSGLVLADPVYYLDTTDMYVVNSEGCSVNRNLAMLLLGRPLWYHMFTTRCGNDFDQLLRYALKRLNRDQEVCSEPLSKISFFMCRFGGVYPANFDYASTFVTFHMATYAHIEVNVVSGTSKQLTREVNCTIGYPSEPILSVASAFATSGLYNKGCTKADVLMAVKNEIKKSSGIVRLNKGDLGETLACALIGYQLDYIREQSAFKDKQSRQNCAQLLTEPVSLQRFLIALIDEAEFVDELKLLEGYYVNATHFIRLPYRTGYSTCNHIIDRGAGVITYENSRALDFFVEAFRIPCDAAVESSDGLPAPPNSSNANSLGNWGTMKDSLNEVHNEKEETVKQETYFDRNVNLEVGSWRGNTIFETKLKSLVYFSASAQVKYLPKRLYSEVRWLETPREVGNTDNDRPDDDGEAENGYDNIHIRFSVKNYKDPITRKEANDFLDAMVLGCEPVNAVQDPKGERIFVSVLINVGAGVVAPFVEVASVGRVLRSNKSVARPHIKICLGLNTPPPQTDQENPGPDLPHCFQYFEGTVLDLFKEIACSQNENTEALFRLQLGHLLDKDRLKLLGQKEKQKSEPLR